jgi:hypothetical protein
MTGVRRALCGCCGVDACGFGSLGTPCNAITDSDCPSTLAVTFSSSEHIFSADCNFGVGATDCQQTAVISAIASMVITVTQLPTTQCIYEGSASVSGTSISTPCAGGGGTSTFTTIDVRLSGVSHILTSAQLTACQADCASGKCAGITAQIRVTKSNGATYDFSARWLDNCIPDCATTVPCYNSYANRVPDEMRTESSDCPSTNHASACVTGNGWTSNCGDSTGSRSSTDHIFTVAIS